MDDGPNYSNEENRRIIENHLDVTRTVHNGDWRGRSVDRAYLCALHEAIFRGVRDQHAGRHRDRGRGSEYITFGIPRRRSVHRDSVANELDKLFKRVRISIGDCHTFTEDPSYERSAIYLAVWAHAEVIRIHPFEDGNGRASRLLLCALLVELGLPAVPTEVPKQEYLRALRSYDNGEGTGLLEDLYLELIAGAIPSPQTDCP